MKEARRDRLPRLIVAWLPFPCERREGGKSNEPGELEAAQAATIDSTGRVDS